MSSIPAHDLSLGTQTRCQVCGREDLQAILDLGHQAPCDSLLTPAELDLPESTYPLRLIRCRDCGLAQIDFVVDPTVLFHANYPYRSGITETLATNLRGISDLLVERFAMEAGSLAVDIGSNDGSILRGFQSHGMRVLGVEPTNVAQIAIEAGVPTCQEFFSETLAREIRAEHGPARAVTATNMFAHVARLGDLIRGVEHLLDTGGVFLTESHYVLDLLDTVQYDSIYHEHLKYYSLADLIRLFDYYDFTVTDAERIPNYGGSIRVFATKGKGHSGTNRLAEILAMEERRGLRQSTIYDRFVERVERSRIELMTRALDIRASGQQMVGIGCPGRCSSLLNYSGIDRLLMPYIAEQSTCLKVGLHLPGNHIPVVDESRMLEEQPAVALMLSWHYARPIAAKLRQKGLRSRILVPLPEVHELEEV